MCSINSPHATSPWQSQWKASEQHWVAMGLDGDSALADELVAIETHADENALLNYCNALQKV